MNSELNVNSMYNEGTIFSFEVLIPYFEEILNFDELQFSSFSEQDLNIFDKKDIEIK